MLRSKQLLPFAKGARAWIVGGTVSKANTLDSAKSSITGSEDGNSEQGFSANNHGQGSNFNMLVPKLEETALGPVPKATDAPVSATAFHRIRQQSSSSAFIAPSVLPRNSGVNPATIPSRNVNVLLSSAAAKHHVEEKAGTVDVAVTTDSAVGSGRTVSTLKDTSSVIDQSKATVIHDLHEAASISTKPEDVGLVAFGRIAIRANTSELCATSKVKVTESCGAPNKSILAEPQCTVSGETGDSSKRNTSTVRAPPGLVRPLQDKGNSSRQTAAASENHTIFFGTLDAPVVVPNSHSEKERVIRDKIDPLEGSVVTGSHQEAGRKTPLNPKSIRPDVTGGQKQRGNSTRNCVSKGGLNTGFPGSRRKSVGHPRTDCHSNRSRKESGWENASSEMIDQVSSILGRLGWTSEAVAALAEFNTKLGAYHINEVLKHQREPFLAWEFFNWAGRQRGYKHDVRTYTTMIGILGRVGDFDACNMLLKNMRKAGCEPSVVTFNRLIHSYGRANDLNEALKIFHHMQEVGCQPDRVTYCTLIDLHSKSGLHDTAMDICEKMWQAGFQPDTFSYTLIIHCLGKAGNLTAANKMFNEMIDRGCTPNLVTYNIMIDLHAKAAKYHMALKLYNDMQDAGHRPDKVTYNVIMEVLGHSGNPDEAEEVFYEMVREGWTGDALTFGLLVNMWGLASNVDKAREWYMKMLDSGLTPNAPTITSLLGAYLRAHQYEGAMQVLDSLAKWGLTPTLPTYTLLLDSCTTCGRREDVDSVLHLMKSTGHPAHILLSKVLEVGVEESRAHIQQFFQSLRLEDQEAKRGFADALIEFLCRSEHKAKAGHVWEVAMENNLYPLAISQKVPNNWIVDLHVMSKGTAVVALSRTLASLRERMLSTGVVPDRIEIVTGWGKHSRVSGLSLVKNAVQNMLGALGSPFYIDNANVGCFISAGQPLADWLHQSDMDHKLAL